jgi:hypothetical protein
MMQAKEHVSPTPLSSEPAWVEATIAVDLAEGNYLLDDGRIARQATSCVVTPAPGDRVLVAVCRADSYIVHLLSRSRGVEAFMGVPGAQQLTIRQPHIALTATEQVSLRSLRDVEVTAVNGVLSFNAYNLFSTVTESLVQNVRHYIGNVEQYLLDVKQILRLHGKQASITAENDVKVDGDRISMG